MDSKKLADFSAAITLNGSTVACHPKRLRTVSKLLVADQKPRLALVSLELSSRHTSSDLSRRELSELLAPTRRVFACAPQWELLAEHHAEGPEPIVDFVAVYSPSKLGDPSCGGYLDDDWVEDLFFEDELFEDIPFDLVEETAYVVHSPADSLARLEIALSNARSDTPWTSRNLAGVRSWTDAGLAAELAEVAASADLWEVHAATHRLVSSALHEAPTSTDPACAYSGLHALATVPKDHRPVALKTLEHGYSGQDDVEAALWRIVSYQIARGASPAKVLSNSREALLG